VGGVEFERMWCVASRCGAVKHLHVQGRNNAMTDPAAARFAGRLAVTRSRRQVLSAASKATVAGVGAALVARPLGIIGTQPSAAAQGSASVGIVDFAFDPSSVAVDAGATVTWTNQGAAPHTVTADDGSFDSGTLDAGASFSFTFTSAGTVSYHCTIHPNMVGSVVVSGGATPETPTPTAPAAVMPATGSGPDGADMSPWLGVALAGGAAALLAGRGLRRGAAAPEE
jgi:plastocyanin